MSTAKYYAQTAAHAVKFGLWANVNSAGAITAIGKRNNMPGIPQDELTMQQHEAMRNDGWLDPMDAKRLAEQLASAKLVSAKYKESMEHYINKIGELENKIRGLMVASGSAK